MDKTEERLFIEKLIALIGDMRPNVNIQASELFDEEYRDIIIRAILSKKREEEEIEKNITKIFDETKRVFN